MDMDEPTGPPMMPTAGWYLDPDAGDRWRYWDGARWTEYRAPIAGGAERDPHSFSAWFEESVSEVRAVLWPVGVLVAALWVAVAVPFVVVTLWAFGSSEGTEIRGLLDIGWGGSTTELTDAEADRVAELAGDIAWRMMPWLVVAAVFAVVVAAWTFAMVARSTGRRIEGDERRTRVGALVVGALGRVLPLLGTVLVLSTLFVAGVTLLLSPMIILIVADAGAVAVALAAVFGTVASAIVSVAVGVRLSLAPALAALGGRGLGIRRSWELTDGQWLGVLGRQVVASLIASAIGGVVSFALGFSVFLGFVTFVVITALFQAFSNAVTTVVVAPAQVVLVRHLAEQHDRQADEA
jgi:hypothetical protein